jgi:hypothetical protein
VRERIQRHFAMGGHPPLGDPAEYAHYFELAYGDERDRRHYIDARVKGAEPSYGHVALAALMTAGRARIIWSTNFDPCVETSAARVFGNTAELTVASLDNPVVAEQALSEERWPLYIKLHGDFQSQRLKNIADELREQDARLRATLLDACRRYGLIVIGYSGRDASIMEALEEAAEPGGYPAGLFWIYRGDTPPLPRVEALVAKAAAAGIDAAIVEAETFDEVVADALRQMPDVPEELLAAVDRQAPRLKDAPVPEAGTAWPVVRTNALPVVEFPSTCRRMESTIGGAKELRDAVKAEGISNEVIVARTKPGVLAFGADAALRKALAGHAITRTDLHPIEPARLAWESGEHGLLAEAIAVALGRERPLLVRRRRRQWVLVVDPQKRDDPALGPVREAADGLVGRLPSGGHWGEAVGLRLDLRLDRLWLLLEPTIWLGRSGGPRPAKDTDFVRERRARRYNPGAARLLDAWIDVLLRGESPARVSAFGGVDGIDAAFVIDKTTAFSRRAQATASGYRTEAA